MSSRNQNEQVQHVYHCCLCLIFDPYENNVWEKSNDAYSLSIRVQTTINHISIFTFFMFFTKI